MLSETADHIANVSVIDTHTHQQGDYAWEGPNAPDILSDLFGWYSSSDLIIAGASLEAVARLQDSSNEDLEGRFADIATDAATCFERHSKGPALAYRWS